MSGWNDSVSRRRLLQTVGGAVGAVGVTGTAAGSGDLVEVNVGYRSASGRGAARAQARSVVREFGFDALTVRVSRVAADRLARRADVRYVEENGEMRAIAQTLPWGVDRVDAEAVHADGETGGDGTDGAGGADVAIIDTGIDSNHRDLEANLGSGTAFVESRGPYAEPWDDDNGHGTHCAGIADAADNTRGVVGVSTAATLHAVKVLDKNGSGSYSDVAAGIEYVADQGWDVASLSLGGSKSQVVEDACEYAYGAGVLLVAAAGNSGPCSDCVGYPAAEPEVVAVSATKKNDGLAGYSSTGPEVELAAPGTNIYSTYAGGGYETLSGTSMACPHVSGAGAQLMDNGYSNVEARSQLADTAEDVGLGTNEQGNGLLDVEAALAGSTDSAPSVAWVTPADGDTVSGSVAIQIGASDSEDGDDSLTVEWQVDGGTWRTATYDATSGYYEDSWDSTGVADGDHTLTATATDSAGNTSSSAITVATDNVESAPTVDSLSLSEVETSDGDAEFDADWAVSDDDGDLSSLDLVLRDSGGTTEDSASPSVSGDAASGTARLVAAGDDGSGETFTVEATVTDGAGNSDSDTASATETEATSTAPTVDSYAVTEAGSPNPHLEITADWTVGDEDGDLATVTVTAEDADGSAFAETHTHSVGGSSASGTDEFKFQHADGETADVTVTVTDGAGDEDSATRSVTE